jgi:iron complex outermembrane receptor protein
MGASSRRLLAAGASGFALVLACQPAHAAAAAAAGSTEVNEVIVTGTRTTGLKAVDSPAPIQVLGSDILKRTGQPELIQSLAQNIPSIQAQSFGGDASAFHLSVKLRGLSPNHTLVLVNGKRRHGTANVVVSGGAFGGNAAADIGLLPVAAIDHVEVLQEGAAAQYGTDAIAGVVNIILKKNTAGGLLSATGGKYIDGGGETGEAVANIGLAPIENAYLNVTVETKYHGFSFRGDIDPRVSPDTKSGAALLAKYPLVASAPNYPYVNRIAGDAQYRQTTALFNAGYEFSDNLEVYAFGTGAYKWGQAYENYRLPSVVLGKGPTDIPYPQGFSPKESIEENDYAFTLGARGAVAGWNWDLASTYGYDLDKVYVLNSANASVYADSSTLTSPGFTQTKFHDGDFEASQFTNTLDLTHDFEVGLATPLTFAAGVEYRKERYAIIAGDPQSYYKTGAQSFFGYAPVNAGAHTRHTEAVYIDLAADPLKAWKVDLAARYENYSDFGDTTVVKGTTRYDFNDMIAIRATASTGFRAPTLAEEFYSGINVGPTTISGVFAPNSPGAKFLGVSGLGPEKSKNFSVGLVAHPYPGLTMTLDLYEITIKNRIVQSGNFFGYNSNKNVVQSPSVLAALVGNGVTIDPAIFAASSGSVSVVTFVNGVDTRNRGADFVATYTSDFERLGRVDWSLSANYNGMEVQKVRAPPSNVDPRVVLLDAAAVTSLTSSTPKYRATAGAFWTLGRFSVNLRESFYGGSHGLVQDPIGAFFDKIQIKPVVLTDLEASYEALKGVKLTVGANNAFNTYPTKQNAAYRAAQFATTSSGYAGSVYPDFSPFGINGGFYYGRLTVSF